VHRPARVLFSSSGKDSPIPAHSLRQLVSCRGESNDFGQAGSALPPITGYTSRKWLSCFPVTTSHQASWVRVESWLRDTNCFTKLKTILVLSLIVKKQSHNRTVYCLHLFWCFYQIILIQLFVIIAKVFIASDSATWLAFLRLGPQVCVPNSCCCVSDWLNYMTGYFIKLIT
jgi:hypothetical protein